MSLIYRLIFLTLFSLLSVVSAKKEKGTLYKPPKGFPFAGDGTWYNTTGADGVKGYGSCGEVHQGTEMVVALNAVQMWAHWPLPKNPNTNPMCGHKVEIYQYNNVTGEVFKNGTVLATIVDTCPPCANGSIDMSPSAFNKLADLGKGRIHIAWHFVDSKKPGVKA